MTAAVLGQVSMDVLLHPSVIAAIVSELVFLFLVPYSVRGAQVGRRMVPLKVFGVT